ncbi:MAG: outer membrane autotransporter protein [Motiliproteus sp.]|jgi:outer membrane autotransporter protein
MKTVFKRKTLHIAMSAALLSLTSLPSLVQADPLATYSLGGVDGGAGATSLSLTNGSAVNNLVILKDMTMVNNDGTIETTDPANAALVINLGASVTTLTNTGTIQNNSSDYTSNDNTSLVVLSVAGNIEYDDQMINEGIISASIIKDFTFTSTDITVKAIGMNIAGDMDGTLSNTGQINISSAYQGSTNVNGVYGAGVYVEGSAAGTITNENDIKITSAYSSENRNDINGIYIANNLTGSIINAADATITAEATNYNEDSGDDVTATGIYVGGDVAGDITNDGTITARAISIDDDAEAFGIYARSLSGDIINKGEIFVEAKAINDTVSSVMGIYVYSGVSQSGSIINSGLISIDSVGSDEIEGAGIYVGRDMAGELRNEGTIILKATLNAHSAESFYGIDISTLSGTLTNTSTGSIDVSGTATEYSQDFGGIDISKLTGTLNNQGSIRVTGIGESDMVAATGMDISRMEGTGNINNSGEIVVTGMRNAEATGVNISPLDGQFNNSGTIIAIDERGYDLAVDVYSGTGSFNNLGGGLIEGDIDIGGSVAVMNAGTISLPSIHQGDIAGDYSQTATGTLRIGAVSDILYGSLVVGGTANFAEGTTIDVDVAGTNSLDVDSELLAVISAGVLEATTFTVIDNSALLNFSALIDLDADTVALQAEKGQTIVEAIRVAGKPSTQGAAAVFDTAPSGLAAATAELNLLATEQEVANAVETTVPGITGGVAQLTGFTSAAVTRVVASRQASARGLASGDGFLTERHLWFKPFGSWTDQDERQGVTGYDINSYGLAFGADGDISSMWHVGFALAYINSAVESNLSAGRHDIAMDTYEAKVYATASLDEVTAVNLQAGVGTSAYDSRRLVYTGDVAAAKYDSWNAQLSAALERSFQSGEKTLLTPYVHADYSYVDVESYTETGAGALNLNVAADNAASLIFGAGVKTNHAVSDELVLMADAGVGYDVLTESSNLTSSFTGGGANFTTAGIKPDEWVYNASVGAAYNLENGTEVSANYTLNAREDYTDQAVSVNVRTLF